MNEKRDKKRLKELGEYLRTLREGLNMSQDELAAQCDINKSKISLIENGKKDYTITTFLELARGLGIHPQELLNKDFKFLKDD